jgi:hypothetical protein
LLEEEVDEDLSDDVLDGAVTDAGVEPVVVVRDIGEGVHACGGFLANSSILALMFSAVCSAVTVHSGYSDQDPLPRSRSRCSCSSGARESLAFRFCAVSFLR